MNLGTYDGLIDRDFYRYPGMLYLKATELPDPGLAGGLPFAAGPEGLHPEPGIQSDRSPESSQSNAPPLFLPLAGVQVNLSSLQHAPVLEVGVDHSHDYQLVFLTGHEEIAKCTIWGIASHEMEIRGRRIDVPRKAVKRGYDAIRILPGVGGGDRRFTHIRLVK